MIINHGHRTVGYSPSLAAVAVSLSMAVSSPWRTSGVCATGTLP